MPGAIERLIAQARTSRQTSLRLSAITAFDMRREVWRNAYILIKSPATLLHTSNLPDCYKFSIQIPPP